MLRKPRGGLFTERALPDVSGAALLLMVGAPYAYAAAFPAGTRPAAFPAAGTDAVRTRSGYLLISSVQASVNTDSYTDGPHGRRVRSKTVNRGPSALRCGSGVCFEKGMKKPMIDIAVLGLGTVGNGVYEVIAGNGPHIARSLGGEALRIKRVLDLRTFDTHPLRGVVTNDFACILGDPDIRVVVETMGGLHPAYEFSKAALESGRSVVTSNKAVVEEYGRELTETARQNGVYYLYEAAVGGGIPLISTLHGSFGANGIRRIAGILNGTTNYILTRLRDCRAIEGIRGILPAHTEAAALLGYSLKLLGVYENGETYTAPCLVPFESLLSATEDVFNAVSITGTAVGEVVLYGRGAGALPTASAIVSDVIEAINGTCPPVFRAESDEPDAKAAPARRFVYADVIPDAVPRGAMRTSGGGCGFIVGADADTSVWSCLPGYCEYRVLDPLDAPENA